MSDTEKSPPKNNAIRNNLVLFVLLALGALAAFVSWKRARNPLRLWAKTVEEHHQLEIDTALQRCFGTSTPQGLRDLAATVRRTALPAPFKDCHRGPMAELLVSPNAFTSSMQGTPLEVYHVRERERVALQRLMASLRLLEHVVSSARDNPTDAQRTEIASKLEEAVPDIDQERKTFEDLVSTARDQAGIF
jgi:hypothetical protein